jgi:hypothetical protein
VELLFDLSSERVHSNSSNNSLALALGAHSLGHEEGVGVVLVVLGSDGELGKFLGLTSHRRLVNKDILSREQNRVCGEFHALFYQVDVAYLQKLSVHFHVFSIADNGANTLIGLSDQFLELSLFHKVVSSCHGDDDCDSHEDRGSLNPSVARMLPSADHDGHEGCNYKDLENSVFEAISNHLPNRSYLCQSFLVFPESVLLDNMYLLVSSCLDVLRSSWDSIL